ncbi:23S rRNA (adenine(2503)-C(2))-methyltransferase RlmN [Helicobacter didelphidarum]|uniref:Probable dual-specificity RNA methyltransferase RlmN n=2 Tax=Helicobacter didelphidarum TaxID=2040648 RepID=A0A3D8INJ3_9HELI|nr:23S rRNA (adenine(2503)-C(2))-methyltransferase RlmN [Helicobacter didelphidarum]
MQPKFRAKQIYHWLYCRYVTQFSDMKNIPKIMQKQLKDKFCNVEKYLFQDLQQYKYSSQTCNQVFELNKQRDTQANISPRQDSDIQSQHANFSTIYPIQIEESKDGTKKYLFQTHDNLSFESVFIKMREKIFDNEGKILKGEKYTFCVSSQVGCRVGCVFCSTAKGGFVRNLSVGEIVQQVVFLKRDNNLDSNKSVNIVFMGMGEPLDNFSNVIKAIRIISHKDGLNIATRRHTISTSGIAPQIEKLGALDLGVQIALSLHAVDDSLRSQLIPMNRVYNLERVLDSLRKFPLHTRNRILFEYLVIKDMNDDLASAKKLVKLLHGFRSKVNLIPFNPHEESQFKRPEKEKVQAFADYLYNRGIVATIRESKGLDISAACGQLREKILQGNQERI